EGLNRGNAALPDRTGTGGGELLGDHDMGKALEAARAAAHWRIAAQVMQAAHDRALAAERANAAADIVLGRNERCLLFAGRYLSCPCHGHPRYWVVSCGATRAFEPLIRRSSMPPVPVLRFAPSPNGRLHLGHALSALTGYHMARRLAGRFLLRIEDIDTG